MEHSYIDQYGHLDSYIHKIDPRIKIISTVIMILSIILTPPVSFYSFLLYALLIACLVFLSKIPFGFVLKRSLVVFPFVVLAACFIPFFKEGEIAGGYSFGALRVQVTYAGLTIFWNIFIKAYLSILCMALLAASTGFPSLLKGLEKLKVPGLLIMIFSFMYRYFFIIIDELMKMKQAKDSRSIGGSRWFHIKVFANMIGMLFVRAYERGEKVYIAMCSRGFTGAIRLVNPIAVKRSDVYFLVTIVCLVAVIKTIGG